MTPDAPLQLTRESGFHPRTSALTRTFGEYRGFWVPQHFAKAGAIEEYWACRERVVIMDLSPLRKLEILGPDAEQFAQGLFPRDVRKLAVGQVVYTPMCYEHGGMVDDGTLFRLGENNFRWIGGDDASLLWIKEQAARTGANVLLKTASDQIHNVAVQGPKSRDTLRAIVWTPPGRPSIDELGWFRFTIGRIGGYDGIPVLVSRTGYTGELGYEVFCHPKDAPAVWDAIMAAGAPHGISPFGFEALDMVRIEAGLSSAAMTSTPPPTRSRPASALRCRRRRRRTISARPRSCAAAPLRCASSSGWRSPATRRPSHGDQVYVGRAEIGVVTSAMRSPLLEEDDRPGAPRRRPCRAGHGACDRQARRHRRTARRDGRALPVLRPGENARARLSRRADRRTAATLPMSFPRK